MANKLFTSTGERTDTQLAYKVRCFPWFDLPDAAKQLVSWRRYNAMYKSTFLERVNEDMTHYTFKGRNYQIVWAYNNVPTELEWERKSPMYLLSVDLRFSPAIKEMAVAILSF